MATREEGLWDRSSIYSEQAKGLWALRKGGRKVRGCCWGGERASQAGEWGEWEIHSTRCRQQSPFPASICSLPQARPPIRWRCCRRVLAAFNVSCLLAGWTALSSVQERGKCCPTTPNFVLLLPHWLAALPSHCQDLCVSSCPPIGNTLVKCLLTGF